MKDAYNILNIKQTGHVLDSGNLLVSTPLLHDFYFGHSVILLVEREFTSTMGFILNNLSRNVVSDIVIEMSDVHFPIFIGGPVNQDRVFYIYKNNNIHNSISINNGLFWGGDIDQIKNFIKDGIISKDEIKFFLGYSGWQEQQLEEEIRRDSWIITKPNSIDEILNTNANNLWKSVVAKLGKDYKNWFNFPVNPMDN